MSEDKVNRPNPYKGKSLEDLKKARWYLDKLIEEIEVKEGK